MIDVIPDTINSTMSRTAKGKQILLETSDFKKSYGSNITVFISWKVWQITIGAAAIIIHNT